MGNRRKKNTHKISCSYLTWAVWMGLAHCYRAKRSEDEEAEVAAAAPSGGQDGGCCNHVEQGNPAQLGKHVSNLHYDCRVMKWIFFYKVPTPMLTKSA